MQASFEILAADTGFVGREIQIEKKNDVLPAKLKHSKTVISFIVLLLQ